MHMAHIAYFPQMAAQEIVFLKALKSWEVKETKQSLETERSAFQLGADRSSFRIQSYSSPGQEPQRCCRTWALLSSSLGSFSPEQVRALCTSPPT